MSLRTRITLTLVGITAMLLAPAIYGMLNLRECPDPTAFERANYIRTLQSWKM